MSYYAFISNQTVINVIVAKTIEDALFVMPEGLTCVEYQEKDFVEPGWIYNGSTFEQPEVPNE